MTHWFFGGSEDDTFVAVQGENNFYGGGGYDTIDFSNLDAPINAELSGAWYSNVDTLDFGIIKQVEAMIGTPFKDFLGGSSVNNILTGGGGDDTLLGLAGSDTLTGGPGADTFWYTAVAHSTVAASGRDLITDFSHADGDRIDVSHIESHGLGGPDVHFAFVQKFDGHAFELKAPFSATLGNYLVQGDINGDGKADFAIQVHSLDGPLVATDFVL